MLSRFARLTGKALDGKQRARVPHSAPLPGCLVSLPTRSPGDRGLAAG